MAYEKRTLVDGVTLLNKDLLDHMQDGIAELSEKAEGLAFTDAECREAFVAAMNEKAAKIGMTNTTFTDPTGRSNPSCARDMCKCLFHASGYERLQEIWSTPSKEIRFIQPDNSVRTLSIKHSLITSTLTQYYNVLGGKGGSMSKNTEMEPGIRIPEYISNMAAICQSAKNPDDFYAIVTMGYYTDTSTAYAQKMTAIKDVMDYIDSDGTATIDPDADHICAFKLPKYNARSFHSDALTPVYTKDEATKFYPASMSKIMTAMITLDYVTDLNEKVTMTQEDVDAFPSSVWYTKDILVGETLTYNDIMHMMLMPSSNIATEILRRVVGRKILNSKNIM